LSELSPAAAAHDRAVIATVEAAAPQKDHCLITPPSRV
jgi:hypothetical protein